MGKVQQTFFSSLSALVAGTKGESEKDELLMESGIEKDPEAEIARLNEELEGLEAERKANDREIFDLMEKETHKGEVHVEEIHNLKKRNLEISLTILTKRNETKRIGIRDTESN